MSSPNSKINEAMLGVKRAHCDEEEEGFALNREIQNKRINLIKDDDEEEKLPFAGDQEEEEVEQEPVAEIPEEQPIANDNHHCNENLFECVTGTQVDFPNTEEEVGGRVQLLVSTRIPPILATAAYIRKFVFQPDEKDDKILTSNYDESIKFDKEVFTKSSDVIQVLSYINELAYTNTYNKYIFFERIKAIGIEKGMKNSKFELCLLNSKGQAMNDTIIVLSNGHIENKMMLKKDTGLKFPNLTFKSKIRQEIAPVTKNPEIANQIRQCNLYKIFKINRLSNTKIFYKNGKEVTKFQENFKFNLIAGFGTLGSADRGKAVDANNSIIPNRFDNRVFPSFNLILAVVEN